MPALKLSLAFSLFTKPYNWARNVPTSTSTASAAAPATAVTSNSSLPFSFSFNNSRTGWRRITPLSCAHLNYSNNYTNNRCSSNGDSNFLGFTFGDRNKRSSFSFSYCNNASSSSASSDSGGFSRPDSGVAAEMGSDSKINDVDWYHNDHLKDANQLSKSSPVQKHDGHNQEACSKFLTLPTVLTLGRVAAVPLLICTFYVDTWWGRTATTSIFIAAAITDWLDGYLARKMRLGTAFGAFLDPVADKLMVAATLVLLCTRPLEMFGQHPWLLTVPSIAIIGREITMSAVREWAASQNSKLSEAVAVNNLGNGKLPHR
ncbi:hypothetical protein K2173_009974 [Erythroxylum novogranatense]|uniref:CDP-diacylglycerol--glycerol-3-phosphate 1-phosphatidyltransferase n=1 Tax=Erythroxylum novogranatense TaxID=1862640 RepID=A0AAV8T0S1_9ROSI|nr:hypothetical protein K2173_009974 [Erythroxylum novogranatense]